MADTDASQSALAPGERFAGQYTIVEKIGEGGYSKVYRASQDSGGPDVALKLVEPNFDEETNRAVLQHFYREALLTSALRHPNTVTPIDYGRTESGVAYIVMEFLDGESVSDMLDRGEALDIERVRLILIDVLMSLQEAHDRSIVHSDIKASNIFLQAGKPNARVLDFGVAQIIEDGADGDQIYGTPFYIAPEVALGRAVRSRSDIYSLGITGYEMLMITLPFEGETVRDLLRAHVTQPMPGLPTEIENTVVGKFIRRATSKSADSRPSAQEAIELLGDPGGNVEDSFTDLVSPASLMASGNQPIVPEQPAGFRLPSTSMVATTEFPFRGRRQEVERLTRALRRKTATGGGVLLTGQLGVGKRRLVAEALAGNVGELDPNNAFIMSCRSCLVDGRVDIARLFEEFQKRFGTDLPESMRRQLRALVSRHWQQEAGPFDADQTLLEQSLHNLVMLAHHRAGLAWAIFGLEYADDAFIRYLIQVLDIVQRDRTPLTVVITLSTDQPYTSRTTQYFMRNVGSGVWQNMQRIDLQPVEPAAMRTIVDGVGRLTDDVRDVLLEKSDGNPGKLRGLLTSGIVNSVFKMEHGRLVRSLRGKLSALVDTIPGTQPIEQRVESLIRKERLFGLLAAVSFLGDEFLESSARAALKRLSESLGDDVQADLDRAIDLNLVVRSDDAPDLLRFLHPFVGETLRSKLPEDLHDLYARTAAEVLHRFAVNVDNWRQAERLFGALNDPDSACVCALKGAELADGSGDVLAAEEMYTAAFARWEETGRGQSEVLYRIELGLARSKLAQGALGSAREMLRDVMERASAAGNRDAEVEARLDLAQIAILLGDTAEMAPSVQRIIALARDSRNPEHYIRALLVVGDYSRASGRRKEAARAYVEAERRAAGSGLHLLRAKARTGIARVLAFEGKFRRADQLLSEATAFLRQDRQFDLLIEVLVEQGQIRLAAGAPGAGLFEEAIEIAEEQGHARMVADIMVGQAQSLQAAGDLEAAQLLLLRALDRYRHLAHRRGEARTLRDLADIALERGQVAAATTYVQEALDAFATAKDALGWATTYQIQAQVLLAQGKNDAARTAADEAVRRFRAAMARKDEIGALLTLAAVHAAAGNQDASEAAFESAHSMAENIADPELKARIDEERMRLRA